MSASVQWIRLDADWPEVAVLHADEALVALNKPAGLLVARDRWDPARVNLMDLVQAALQAGADWTKRLGVSYLANVHRLDLDTSGVLLLAATRAALSNLVRQFRDRQVQKTYLALVRREPSQDAMTVEAPIAPDLARPGRSVVAPRRGVPAVTRLEVVERFRGYTLVRAMPETGRTHQVRLHLRHVGCPCVADPFYGDGAPLLLSRIKPRYKEPAGGERPLLARTGLHAAAVDLRHPASGQPLHLEAPVPRDLAAALNQLRKHAKLSAADGHPAP